MKTFLRFTLRLLLLGGLVAALRRAFDSRRVGSVAGDRGADDAGASRARLALVGDGPSPFAPLHRGRPAPRAAEPVDGRCPPGFPVKGKRSSGIYHVPGGLSYERTVPDRCYATPGDAEADGMRAARR